MPIRWNTTLETGIRQVDLQHQELIEMINELETAHLVGNDLIALEEILPRLKAYVLFHFNEEEMLAAGIAYGTAHIEQHLLEHRKFIDKIASIKFDQIEDVRCAVGDLVEFLQSWLVEHIMITDKEMATFYLAHQRQSRGH